MNPDPSEKGSAMMEPQSVGMDFGIGPPHPEPLGGNQHQRWKQYEQHDNDEFGEQKWQMPFTTSTMVVLVTPATTLSVVPTGGVISPEH